MMKRKQIFRLTEARFRRILMESIDKVLSDAHYSYIGKCTQMDAESVQEITHWDEYAESNNYAIQDDYWERGVFEIIPIEEFLQMTDGEYRVNPMDIEYCALNKDLGILFCLSTDGVHYFYK